MTTTDSAKEVKARRTMVSERIAVIAADPKHFLYGVKHSPLLTELLSAAAAAGIFHETLGRLFDIVVAEFHDESNEKSAMERAASDMAYRIGNHIVAWAQSNSEASSLLMLAGALPFYQFSCSSIEGFTHGGHELAELYSSLGREAEGLGYFGTLEQGYFQRHLGQIGLPQIGVRLFTASLLVKQSEALKAATELASELEAERKKKKIAYAVAATVVGITGAILLA